MKSFLIIILITASPIFLFSQNKKIDKIIKDYKDAQYENCIVGSNAYLEKDKTLPAPYLYLGFSCFNSYMKQESKEQYKLLKEAAENIGTGIKKKGGDEIFKEFSKESSSLQTELHTVADKLYKAGKESDSKFYYSSLVKIFKDTTDEYMKFYHPEKLKPDHDIVGLMEKGQLNVTDANGLKQGFWKKVYDNGNTAYEVVFKDDKPIGKYKRYHKNGELQMVINYDTKGEFGDYEAYDNLGVLLAKGFYKGKLKDSTWTYFYAGEKIMRTENYKNDKLDGSQKVFYPDGSVYEEKIWKDGVENGIWQQLYPDGTPMMRTNFVNGKREGKFVRYFKSGDVQISGIYKSDIQEGKWEYILKEGDKKEIIEYINGIAKNQDELDEKESEEYKKAIEQSKDIVDPQDYMTNPDEYNRIKNK